MTCSISRKIFSIGIFFIPVLLFIIDLTSTESAAAEFTGTHIPVVINLHKDAGLSKDEAKGAIKEASKYLKNAGFKLVVVDTNPNASEGDVGNDGKIDWSKEEWKHLIKAGRDEIEKTPNKKGIKVSFVKEPEKGETTVGWAVHREPVVAIQRQTDAGGTFKPTLTGQAIAHEIAHIMTLSTKMKIESSIESDNDGHVPGDSANLMYPYNTVSSKKLTKAQIDEMNKRKYVHGKCSTQFEKAYPAKKEKQQYGAKTDAIGDSSGSGHTDLLNIYLWSLQDGATLRGQLSLGDIFSGAVDTSYALAFDSDNDPSTGYTYKTFSGMEYALEFDVSGDMGSYSATAKVRDLSDNSTTYLTGAVSVDNGKLMDGSAGSMEGLGQLLFEVEKDLMGLGKTTLKEATVGILSEENGGVLDYEMLLFNMDQWLDDPTLQTFGNGIPTPGELYKVTISGLAANDNFDFYVDEELIFSDVLDSSGGWSGGFIFPSYLSNQEIHFLTAQDSTGEFAYSISCPTPEPTTILLLGTGLTGLFIIRRRNG